VTEVISQQQQAAERWLLRSHLATRQVAAIVVVFHDAYRAAPFWITLHDRQSAVGAKGFDGLGYSTKVVVPNLAHDNAVRVSLNKIDLPVEVAVALHLDDFVVSDSLDDVGSAVSVGIDRDLVFVLADPGHPLVGPAVAPSMSDDAVRASIAGEKRES
jgi:hypothetical protein